MPSPTLAFQPGTLCHVHVCEQRVQPYSMTLFHEIIIAIISESEICKSHTRYRHQNVSCKNTLSSHEQCRRKRRQMPIMCNRVCSPVCRWGLHFQWPTAPRSAGWSEACLHHCCDTAEPLLSLHAVNRNIPFAQKQQQRWHSQQKPSFYTETTTVVQSTEYEGMDVCMDQSTEYEGMDVCTVQSTEYEGMHGCLHSPVNWVWRHECLHSPVNWVWKHGCLHSQLSMKSSQHTVQSTEYGGMDVCTVQSTEYEGMHGCLHGPVNWVWRHAWMSAQSSQLSMKEWMSAWASWLSMEAWMSAQSSQLSMKACMDVCMVHSTQYEGMDVCTTQSTQYKSNVCLHCRPAHMLTTRQTMSDVPGFSRLTMTSWMLAL